jgi:LmbE family N-acetylglucosaminyl deacetylase
MKELVDTRPALMVSPHLDDAVFSCGQLIKSRQGTMIVTVLAGFPPGDHAGWSCQTTGLPVAKDANAMRREEDECASRTLGARTAWIDLPAQEYGPADSPAERVRRIEEAMIEAVATTDAQTVFIPLGVSHPDHVIVSEAALLAVLGSNLECYLYMDMPYGQARPGRVRRRLRQIGRKGAIEPLVQFRGDLEAKAEAVRAYSSQVAELQRGFGRHFDAVFTDPEKYWRVQPLA